MDTLGLAFYRVCVLCGKSSPAVVIFELLSRPSDCDTLNQVALVLMDTSCGLSALSCGSGVFKEAQERKWRGIKYMYRSKPWSPAEFARKGMKTVWIIFNRCILFR